MSEQWTPTTDQVRSFYAHDSEDEYHDPIAYPSHVRSAEQAFDRWLARVRREAKAEELRKVSESFERSIVPNGAEIGSWLSDRADRMEAGEQ